MILKGWNTDIWFGFFYKEWDRPWKKPGADPDYFNSGFNEGFL